MIIPVSYHHQSHRSAKSLDFADHKCKAIPQTLTYDELYPGRIFCHCILMNIIFVNDLGLMNFRLSVLFHQWETKYFIVFHQGKFSMFNYFEWTFKLSLFILINTPNPDQV